MNALIQTYQDLSRKDQKLLGIGLVAIIFFLVYQFVYSPFQDKIASLTKQQAYQQELNDWFKQIEPKLKHKNANTSPENNLTPSDLLAKSLTSVKQAFDPIAYKFSQSQSGGIELNFKDISYQQFINWFETFFKTTHELKIQELSITPNAQPGMVAVSLRYETTN